MLHTTQSASFRNGTTVIADNINLYSDDRIKHHETEVVNALSTIKK